MDPEEASGALPTDQTPGALAAGTEEDNASIGLSKAEMRRSLQFKAIITRRRATSLRRRAQVRPAKVRSGLRSRPPWARRPRPARSASNWAASTRLWRNTAARSVRPKASVNHCWTRSTCNKPRVSATCSRSTS